MGIENLHIIIHPDDSESIRRRVQILEEQRLMAILIQEHRRGEHPYGRMRRDCPMCQSS